MQVKASLKNYRRSARKVRELANVLRGMNVENAAFQLMSWSKGSADDILNLLKSVVANAQNNFKLNEEDLYISELKVNEGPTMKRWRPRAHGRAAKILKRTCHVEIILDSKEKKTVKKVEKAENEKKAVEKKDDKKKVEKKVSEVKKSDNKVAEK